MLTIWGYSLRSQARWLGQFRSALATNEGKQFLQRVPSLVKDAQEERSGEASRWHLVADLAKQYSAAGEELEQIKRFAEAEDKDLEELALHDAKLIEEQLDSLAKRLAVAAVPYNDVDLLNKCQIEISAGVGGTEAMLFTSELLKMYKKLAEANGWKWSSMQLENAPLGGVRSSIAGISGDGVYRKLRFEAGVHRVQRIPLTDKSRVHTSTACVCVLPEPEEAEIYVPAKDVRVETMRSPGPGGQNVNKRETAVRVTHIPSKTSVHCSEERYQHLNMKIAYRRLAAILLQRKVDALDEHISSTRKLQMGTRARSEKVRTYSFKDDRVTDHRLRKNASNVDEFMQGGPSLQNFLEELCQLYTLERFEEFLSSENFQTRQTNKVETQRQ